MSNIIDLSARIAARALPSENVTAVDFPVTARQRAGRRRNPLRHYHSQAAIAVTIAGKLHRGEPLRTEDWIDELKWLREGAAAARLLADELERIAEQHGGRAEQ